MANNYDSIPDELKPLKQWVVWRLEERENTKGEMKPTKIPYKTQTTKAATTRKDEWMHFNAALEMLELTRKMPKWYDGCKLSDVGLNGLGFVFTDEDEYMGVDWDHIRNAETGEIETQYVNEMTALNTYCEISQSGEGAHAICKGVIPGEKHRKNNTPYEMYESGRYFVMTGNHIDDTPTEIRESSKESIKAIYDKIDPPKEDKKTVTKVESKRIEDVEIIELCRSASNAEKFYSLYAGNVGEYGGDHSAADMALCSIIAFYTQDEGQIERIFEGSGLVRDKWDRKDYRNRTIENAINGLSETYTPKKESDAFFKVINNRVSAEYSLDGVAWGIKLTIDGVKVNQASKSRRRFDDNLDTRNKQLKDTLKIMSKKKGDEFNNDELNEIIFDIMNVGASLVKQLIDAKAKKAEIKDDEADDIEEDLFEDPLEMLIADDIKAKAKERAIEIMTEGDPIKEIIRIIETIHIGDKKITEALCLGLASQSCLNTQGIQPSAIGGSGSGKSHNVKTFVHTVRPKHVMETSLTPKALYYTDVKPGTIIFSDDTGMDDEMETIIKRATTNYQDITKHTTVVKQEGKEMSIPPRIMWMFTSVDNEGSEQLLNRQLTLNTDESKDHKTGIFNKQVEEAQTGEMGIMEVTEDILIAREIHDIIKSKLFNVAIPFADKIKIADKTNSRNFPLFLDMLKGFTIYKHLQRESNEKGYILANKEDFNCAKIMFENQKENIITKLSDEERKVLRAIGERQLGATRNEIATATGFSYGRVSNILEGRKETNKAGLLDRIAELRIFDESESVKVEEDLTQHRRNKRYIMVNYDPLSLFEGEFITLDEE